MQQQLAGAVATPRLQTLLLGLLALFGIALLASYLPARRATQADPLVALPR